MNKSDIQHHQFENGFRVIYETPINALPITYIRVFCDVGSIHESEQYHGASHFIEHMCFKGTAKISDATKISTNYDENGAYVNATTDKRHTCFIVKCNNPHFQRSINVLSDMINNSLFDKHEYSKEKQVVMEETILLTDQPNTILFHMIDRLLYKGSSFEHPIDTIEYHIKTAQRKHILEYDDIVNMYKRFYHPNRMVLSIVSQIPFPTIVAHLKKTDFVKRNTKGHCRTPTPMPTIRPPSYSLDPQSEIQCTVLNKKGVLATYFGIGFRTCPQTNLDRYTLDLVKYIIGGYMSSRLFKLLRDENGLTYSSKVYTEYFEHTGAFFIYASVNSQKFIRNGTGPGVIPIIIKLLNDLVKQGVFDREIEIAKGFIQGNMVIASENGDSQDIHNGLEYILYDTPDEIVPYSQIYKTYYHSLTKSKINQTIRTYFRKSNMNIVCLGENAPKESVIVRECSKFSAL
jgi:predicted Zn-dependent peptidase